MRYMVVLDLNAKTFKCFNSEELKEFYESNGVFVIDLEIWSV